MEVKSIEYSWKYVTANEILCKVACEFVYAKLIGATDIGEAALYDGENTLGKKIVRLFTGGVWNCECSPAVPVYCRYGLYFEHIATIDGVLVIWRELEHEKREG